MEVKTGKAKTDQLVAAAQKDALETPIIGGTGTNFKRQVDLDVTMNSHNPKLRELRKKLNKGEISPEMFLEQARSLS